MSIPPLGKLEQVPLRSVWSDESGDFTPWLAKPENLKLLGETLGLLLDPEDEEVAVGPFAADILCKDTADGSWVVIENQIEKTDHRHLGQILTYAAGLGANTMVWVASKFTDEHRAVLDWLNENTNDHISFFGLEIELWRIGSSEPAPKFNIISKPNDWSKAVRAQTEAGEREPSNLNKLQYEFWAAFKAYAEEHSNLRLQRPGPRQWMNIALGKADVHLTAIISAWNTETQAFETPEIRVQLYLQSGMAKSRFAKLELEKDAIAKAIDLPLVWHNPANSKLCKIYVRRDANFMDRANWPDCFEWLVRYLNRFTEVFTPFVKQL